MRIRSVKPEYWQHRMHKRLSVSASLLGAALLDYADDEGRFEAEGDRIRGILLPNVQLEKPVEALLRELAALDWLVLYEVTLDGIGVALGQICSFEVHQAIDGRSRSLLPAPPSGWRQKLVSVRRGKRLVEMPKWVRDGEDRNGSSIESAQHPVSIVDQSSIESAQHPVSIVDGQPPEVGGSGVEWKEGRGEEGEKAGSGTASMDGSRKGEFVEQSGVEQLERSARRSEPEGHGSYQSDAEIPTAAEVEAACGLMGVDLAYGREFHEFMTTRHLWVVNRRLVQWRTILKRKWEENRERWMDGSLPGSPYKNKNGGLKNGGGSTGQVPRWKRILLLEERIAGHYANRESLAYDRRRVGKEGAKGCGKRELAGLVVELAELKKAELGAGRAVENVEQFSVG